MLKNNNEELYKQFYYAISQKPTDPREFLVKDITPIRRFDNVRKINFYNPDDINIYVKKLSEEEEANAPDYKHISRDDFIAKCDTHDNYNLMVNNAIKQLPIREWTK